MSSPAMRVVFWPSEDITDDNSLFYAIMDILGISLIAQMVAVRESRVYADQLFVSHDANLDKGSLTGDGSRTQWARS